MISFSRMIHSFSPIIEQLMQGLLSQSSGIKGKIYSVPAYPRYLKR